MTKEKTFRLSNGLVFTGEPALDGYIRGLERVRDELDLADEEATQTINNWLDEAHSTKSRVKAGGEDPAAEEQDAAEEATETTQQTEQAA
ncbi:MAG: hypothetical protein JNM12_09950 [Alphaproteobacteria bacterium]|nr:hypothetical protein [Alphaproteobacteria bacterium]